MKSHDYLFDANTRLSPCGKVMPGFGGGGGSSSSSNATTTTNTDKRLVVNDGIGISSDTSSVTVNALDGEIVTKALDTVQIADATNGQGFGQLVTLADKLFTGAGNLVAATQQTALEQMTQANVETAGKIDNKTITILGVAAAAAFMLGRK